MRRCGGCGTVHNLTTIVIDLHPELLCDGCVRSHDWSGWRFDPILNTYYRH